MELSLNEMVEDLQKSLPQEPNENDQNSINLSFKHENNTYSRKFTKSNKIKVKLILI